MRRNTRREHTWDATRDVCTACGRTRVEIVERKAGCNPRRPVTLPRVRFLEKPDYPEDGNV